MRRVLPLLLALTGCTVAEPLPVYELPPPATAAERERDLQQHLREGQTWEEQERRMKDVKDAFGQPSDVDALGPKTNTSPAK